MQWIEYLAVFMLSMLFGIFIGLMIKPPKNYHGPNASKEIAKIHESDGKRYRFIVVKED
jgi:hypothetical protein